MPDSVLDPSKLADALSPVVDRIRARIHSALGTRPYRTTIIVRTWSGEAVGLGVPHDKRTPLEPWPRVMWSPSSRPGPGGREDTGDAVLTGVSLSYTQAELMPVTDARSECVYEIVEAHGQKQAPQFYTMVGSPVPRRGDGGGDGTDWKITLKQVQGFSPLDSTDA